MTAMQKATSPPPNEEDDYKVPGWYRWAPFLGKPPRMNSHQWRVLGLLGIVSLFDQYDLSLFSLALKQIQADLMIPEAQLGDLGALVRLGALPAFLFGVIADRVGRRKVLLFTIVGYTVLTGATAFAPDAKTFVILQFFARTFAVGELILAYVVIAEELDPETRGWGAGALTALAACGSGLALALFGLVDVLPMGWRALYLIGLIPLAMVAWMRRSLPETTRFEAQQKNSEVRQQENFLKPILDLIRMYPKRILGICSVLLLLNFSADAASFFGPKYLQEEHGWLPWHYSIMGIFGGCIGVVGGPFAGRLSDRYGRKKVAAVFLTANPILAIAFYQLFGWALVPIWVGMVFSGMAATVVLNIYGNELFPTSYRSTASGTRVIVATIGGALSLMTESILFGIMGSHWNALSLMVIGSLAAPIMVLWMLPETSGRVLEEISPEK